MAKNNNGRSAKFKRDGRQARAKLTREAASLKSEIKKYPGAEERMNYGKNRNVVRDAFDSIQTRFRKSRNESY